MAQNKPGGEMFYASFRSDLAPIMLAFQPLMLNWRYYVVQTIFLYIGKLSAKEVSGGSWWAILLAAGFSAARAHGRCGNISP